MRYTETEGRRKRSQRSATIFIQFEAEESGTSMSSGHKVLEMEKERPMANAAMEFEDQKRERHPWQCSNTLLDKRLIYRNVGERRRRSQS